MNTYFLIVYSDFVGDAETRYIMGLVNIVCLAIMLFFNLFIIGRDQFKKTARWLKLR